MRKARGKVFTFPRFFYNWGRKIKLNVLEIVLTSGGGLLVLLGLIEITPIKLNPWSAFARWFGKAANGEVMKKIDELATKNAKLEQDVETLRQELGSKVTKLREEIAEDRAVNCRVRILRFGDELLYDVEHSKEHFDQTLKDISDYNDYCDAHHDFQNEMTVATSEIIREQYKKLFKEHRFKEKRRTQHEDGNE